MNDKSPQQEAEEIAQGCADGLCVLQESDVGLTKETIKRFILQETGLVEKLEQLAIDAETIRLLHSQMVAAEKRGIDKARQERADELKEAAGELMLEIPEVGTPLSKCISANVLIRQQRDQLHSTLTEAQANFAKILQQRADELDQLRAELAVLKDACERSDALAAARLVLLEDNKSEIASTKSALDEARKDSAIVDHLAQCTGGEFEAFNDARFAIGLRAAVSTAIDNAIQGDK